MLSSNYFTRSAKASAALFLALGLGFTACDDDNDDMMDDMEATATITAEGTQFLAENAGKITVSAVNFSDDGWLVVHDASGAVIGKAFVDEDNKGPISITLDAGKSIMFGDMVTVMAHEDTGESEVYEFKGNAADEDQPIKMNNNVVQTTVMYDFPATGTMETYALMEQAAGVSGEAIYYKGSDATYVVLDLDGTPENGMHPAHIHMGTVANPTVVANGNNIAITLETVDGNTGMSITKITQNNSGDAVTYEQLINYNGYINVHLSAADLGTVVASGDIGSNAFTGNMKTYNLAEKDVNGISGTATVKERANGNSLVILNITGTPDGGMHPAHIHMGSVASSPGGIAVTLKTVDGDTGMSMTEVSMADMGTSGDTADDVAVDYADLIDYDGYINVHLSATELGTIVAQGNIGSNATN